MEWVETTGKTVDEATDRALAHLGVHRDDAEVEVIEEPKVGFLGRVRGEARVRARVRPSGPRPKRSRRSGERPRASGGREDRVRAEKKPGAPRRESAKGGPRSTPPVTKSTKVEKSSVKEERMAEGISLAEQGAIAKEFLEGLLSAMDVKAEVSVKELDEETVELSVNANPPTELGILVGPRGTTLQALQEVTRTVVQSKSPSRTDRILVDVAQYRERRVAALGRFAQQVASEVLETGEERALEPMSAADRKAVHDALSDNDRVATRSEGEDPRRFVVVSPA
ncbi:MAG TPA: RNA-binding cell elongation regulator Jag/EloR [Acidimicrobiales bacterium]|jgi:spoIIIJ-associated protein|nr:RNA-binding cell elongation regulator Jag/EloR [Acidimicrobiales bacterium]